MSRTVTCFACLAALLLFATCLPAARSRPVVLTTDCGCEVDDQFAIAYLMKSPDVDLKGIVTTHAPGLKPPASETTAECARQMAKLAGSRVPVFAGSPVALPKRPAPLMNEGVQFILDIARGYSKDNRLALLSIGAATDVASALLADPALVNRIEVIAMAFTSWPDGAKEYNVQNDVAAWQVILDSNVPLTIGSGAVTRKYLLFDAPTVRAMTEGSGEIGEYLYKLFADWVKKEHGEGPGRWILWDVVTPAYLFGLAKATEVKRPILNDNLTFTHTPTSRTIRWIETIDRDKVISQFRKNLKRSD